jgi:hypothetical protein
MRLLIIITKSIRNVTSIRIYIYIYIIQVLKKIIEKEKTTT